MTPLFVATLYEWTPSGHGVSPYFGVNFAGKGVYLLTHDATGALIVDSEYLYQGAVEVINDEHSLFIFSGSYERIATGIPAQFISYLTIDIRDLTANTSIFTGDASYGYGRMGPGGFIGPPANPGVRGPIWNWPVGDARLGLYAKWDQSGTPAYQGGTTTNECWWTSFRVDYYRDK